MVVTACDDAGLGYYSPSPRVASMAISNVLATQDLIREAAQRPRLAKLLAHWLSHVPLYQGHAIPDLAGDGESIVPDLFERLPLITKADIRRDFPCNFLRRGLELDDLLDRDLVELEHTSGTSEERTALLLGRGWWAGQEERALRLNSLIASVLDETPEARRVTITSPVCNNDICYSGRPSRDERLVGRALHVNLSRHPFLWSEVDLERMATEAREWDPHFLDVDPVYGTVFALYCERNGVRLRSLRFIVSSYEFLSVCHRRCLERVFGVPVFNLYGSTETGHLLMESSGSLAELAVAREPRRDECRTSGQRSFDAGSSRFQVRGSPQFMGRSAGMLASHDTALLEVLQPSEENLGELVVTTLDNDYMPLIRYRIGDLVERREEPYRTTYVVHGRATDACRTLDGRRVTVLQVDACFADLAGIAHYQLADAPEAGWVLRYVAETRGPSPASLATLGCRLMALLGLQRPPAIAPTEALLAETSGKFRLCRTR